MNRWVTAGVVTETGGAVYAIVLNRWWPLIGGVVVFVLCCVWAIWSAGRA